MFDLLELQDRIERLVQRRRDLAAEIELAFDRDQIDADQLARMDRQVYGTVESDRPYFDEQRRTRDEAERRRRRE